MIQVFYDKIHTIFDGLENNQKLEIYKQLTKKVGDLGVPYTTKIHMGLHPSSPKKKWGGKAKVTYKEVVGYDPSGKSAITKLKVTGMPKKDHKHIDVNSFVIVQHDYKPNDRYYVCRKTRGKEFLFFGELITDMEQLHKDFFETWRDMANFCDELFNSSTP